jgi:hypothetical protein
LLAPSCISKKQHIKYSPTRVDGSKLKSAFWWFCQRRKWCQVLIHRGIRQFNESRGHKGIKTLKESVINFEFLLHRLDHRTYDCCHKDGFVRIMSQAITNNAITTTTNHLLSPLQRGHRKLEKEFETKLLEYYDMSLNICKEPD